MSDVKSLAAAASAAVAVYPPSTPPSSVLSLLPLLPAPLPACVPSAPPLAPFRPPAAAAAAAAAAAIGIDPPVMTKSYSAIKVVERMLCHLKAQPRPATSSWISVFIWCITNVRSEFGPGFTGRIFNELATEHAGDKGYVSINDAFLNRCCSAFKSDAQLALAEDPWWSPPSQAVLDTVRQADVNSVVNWLATANGMWQRFLARASPSRSVPAAPAAAAAGAGAGSTALDVKHGLSDTDSDNDAGTTSYIERAGKRRAVVVIDSDSDEDVKAHAAKRAKTDVPLPLPEPDLNDENVVDCTCCDNDHSCYSSSSDATMAFDVYKMGTDGKRVLEQSDNAYPIRQRWRIHEWCKSNKRTWVITRYGEMTVTTHFTLKPAGDQHTNTHRLRGATWLDALAASKQSWTVQDARAFLTANLGTYAGTQLNSVNYFLEDPLEQLRCYQFSLESYSSSV